MTDIIKIPKAKVRFSTQRVQRRCKQVMQQRPTTGNSDMADKTGHTYISETMTDGVEIPTAYPAFSTMASSMIKVSSTDCDNDR